MTNELSKFTMAGGVSALKHDDAIDLLNQLSEMELYAPSVDYQEEKSAVSSISPPFGRLFQTLG